MANQVSSASFDQHAKSPLQNQALDPAKLSMQEAQQLIHELQARQQALEKQNAAFQTAQRQLEKRHHLYRDLFELSPLGLLVLDLEARILESNLTAAEMLGVERSKITGRHLADFVAPAEQAIFNIFCQGLRSSSQPQQSEINLIQRDQNGFIAKLNGVALNQNGEKTSYYVTVIDMTVEKQSELQKLEVAGERQRTRILANFINDMSHDLRTPLTKIVTGLYLVGKTTDQELRLNKIDKINTQLLSLTDLLEQLQIMAVLDSLSELAFQPVGINSMLADVITAVKDRAETKQIDIISNFQKDLSKIPLNADNMFLALLSLVNNAIQFTPVGGLISLTTRQQDHHVLIEIADNGIGIPTDILPHIFERFFKADIARSNSTGGAGLGLSLVKRVIELHHGKLEASSNPDIETIFQITLPLNQP